MEEQEKVAEFIEKNSLTAPVEFRLLDLVSELGEVAKNVNESTEYGTTPEDLSIESDELGDALFALLALANSSDINASEALDEAMEKYETRIDDKGEPSSGEI